MFQVKRGDGADNKFTVSSRTKNGQFAEIMQLTPDTTDAADAMESVSPKIRVGAIGYNNGLTTPSDVHCLFYCEGYRASVWNFTYNSTELVMIWTEGQLRFCSHRDGLLVQYGGTITGDTDNDAVSRPLLLLLTPR